jgi:hypothetical protein
MLVRSALSRTPLPRTPIVPTPFVPASEAQRAKVAGQDCVVCGRRPCDPAHLVPQRLGGCAHRDCVIALCRTHHRLYDAAELPLAAYLGTRFSLERRHALTHVSPWPLCRALAGGGWPDPPASGPSRPRLKSRNRSRSTR